MGREESADWPGWWSWELAFTAHVEERMLMRGLNEVELRSMLEGAVELLPARRTGRWVVRTRHAGKAWEVVVEPDEVAKQLTIVTAYRMDE
jgi:hypothetical protein